MPQTPLLSDEARQRILGREIAPASLLVEMGHIARFAEAIGDPNPRYRDDASGGIVAPPTFLRAVGTDHVVTELGDHRARTGMPDPPELASLANVLDASSDWEYAEPVRVGDTITATARITNVSQRTIRVGPAVFLSGVTTYTNQRGATVATQRFTFIRY